MITRRTALSILTALGLATTGATAQVQQAPHYGGTLKVSLQNDLRTLDPTYQTNYGERFVLYVLYNSLFALGRDSSINPELAERWHLEDDGKRLVLHLRRGVKFHDGSDFNAEAVRWNFERRMDEKVNSPSRFQLREIIASIDVVDSGTVALNLKAPTPSLLGMLAQRDGLMMSPSAVTKAGEDFGTNPSGTGPFVFKRWDKGGRVVVEKNKDYWEKGKPYLDGIEYVLTTTPVVGIPRLMTGEVDVVAPLSPIEIRQLEGRPDVSIEQRPVSRWVSLQFRLDRPPFDNPKLRQAVAHAVDRQRIVDVVVGGKGQVAEGSVPPGLWWHDDALKSYPYDPAKAKALLAEIGKPTGVEVTLTSPPESIYGQVTQLVQDQLKAVGINARIQPAPPEWYSQVVQGRVVFLPIRWAARPDPDGLFTHLFHSKSANNTAAYRNASVDELLDRARVATDRDERLKLYKEAGRQMTADLPYIPLFFQPEYAALGKGVGNGPTVWVADEAPRLRDLWKASTK